MIEQLKAQHEKLQEGLPKNKICIREGIILDVGFEDYPKYGFEFFCWRNEECVREMDCFIKYARGGRYLLDVGAFHGLFSMVFCEMNKGASATAIEPFEEPIKVLKEHRNDYGITTINVAFSNWTGTKKLYTWDQHLIRDKLNDSQTEVEVPCMTGDECCKFISPDVIKIDVEGDELVVLQGLKETIEKNHPIIFLELHFTGLGIYHLHEILIMLSNFKYKMIDTETDKEINDTELVCKYKREVRVMFI